MTSAEALKTVLAQNEGLHLGDIVSWSLSGPKRQDEVQRVAEDLGLTDDLPFPRVGPATAYRRAVTGAVKGGKVDERKYDVVKVEEDTKKIIHAIVRKDLITKALRSGSMTKVDGEIVAGSDVDFEVEFKVGFDKEKRDAKADPGEMLVLPDPDQLGHQHPIAVRIRQAYEESCVIYMANDLYKAFIRAFSSWDGASMISGGKLWYVPNYKADKIRDWSEFLTRLGHAPLIIPCFDTNETITSLRDVTKHSIDGQLAELRDELADFSERENVRESTMEDRVKRFDHLVAKAEMYEKILGHEMGELKTKAGEAKKAMLDLIMQRSK